MKFLRATLFSAVLLASGQAYAGGTFASPYCAFVEDAQVLVNFTDIGELRGEVQQRYDHAVAVATDHRTLYSTSPLFIWAGQAKISCAQAIGYLKKHRKWRRRPNYVTLQKCECFYDRMTQYLPR